MFIVDLLRRGDEHGNINIPIISVLVENQLAERAWISHDSTSNSIIEKNRNIIIEYVQIIESKKYKWITSTLHTAKLLHYAKKKESNIFFLSTTPLQNLIITIFSFFRKNKSRYYILLHGELSYLINPAGFGRRLGKIFLEASFKILPFVNVYQITLAYPVFKAIQQKYKLDKNLINFEIPTQSCNNTVLKRYSEAENVNKRTPKLRIGSFGVHSRDKSSHLIYALADYLKDYYDRIEIVTIGVAHSDFNYDQHSMVKHHCKGSLSDALIPRELFLEEIRQLDFALFFYGNNPQYEMVSSGAFSDCVNIGIPFAALSSNYFAHYIEKYGEIGIVKNSIRELAEELIKLSSNNSDYSKFKLNLQLAQNERAYENFECLLLDTFKS